MEIDNTNNLEEIKKKKFNRILKIIIILCFGIMILCILYSCIVQENERKNSWYANVDEDRMIELAKDKIEERFSSAANLSYRYGEVEYKEEDFNRLYYFMFYTVTVSVTNQFGAQTKYFCTVKIYFNKETMEYTVNKPSCNKLLE